MYMYLIVINSATIMMLYAAVYANVLAARQ